MTFLLDTNVVSETRRRTPDPKVMKWLAQIDPSDLCISAMTVGEIAKGVEMRARQDPAQAIDLESWLTTIRTDYADQIIAIHADIAVAWGRLAAKRTLPVVDGLLAATAAVYGMTLATRNERDFANLGIRVLNPWNL